MCGGAPFGTPKLSLPGCVLGVSDQVGKVRDRRLRTRHHDVRHLGDHRDRLKTFRIVFDVAIKRRPDGKRRRAAKKEGVAVGLGISGDLAGKRRARAGPVIDINLLSELVRKRLTDQPSHDIRRSAGREWNNQSDRASGIGVFGGCDLRARQHRGRDGKQQKTRSINSVPQLPSPAPASSRAPGRPRRSVL